QELINSISPLLCAVPNKGPFPEVECIHMNAENPGEVVLTSFDLEKAVRVKCEATVLETGCYAINASKLSQMLKVMDGEEVTITVNGKLETTLVSGKSTQKMSALNSEGFPAIPQINNKALRYDISCALLKKMIAKVSFAMGVNDQRHILNGAFFRVEADKITVVACDGFKMAKCTAKADIVNRSDDNVAVRYSYIVPTKTVQELYRMLPDGEDDRVMMHMSRKYLICYFENMTFYTRLIEGEYIDFDRIILKTHKTFITVDRDRLLGALERAAVVTEERIIGSNRTPVRFAPEGDVLKIMANSSAGSSYEEIEIEHEGEDLIISFNNKYLIDAIRSCECERLRIEMTTVISSINIIPLDLEEGSDELFFLLPIKTKH
ncbi:MAG: DNA polymerase III subunit beta, partial [Clostridia bacterium]|nr:DNA polymerase III subunit beta [Clostridia bacterium]